jgi:hypothetical protein
MDETKNREFVTKTRNNYFLFIYFAIFIFKYVNITFFRRDKYG